MKDVVIVGAGPIGLYTAIKLKLEGVQHITVVDPRAGLYTRAGLIDKAQFQLLKDHLGEEYESFIAYHQTPSRRIRDAERGLYAIAADLDIKIERKRFKSFTEGGVRVVDDSHQSSTIPCDLALDCTGGRRTLLKKVNKQMGEDIFKREPVSESPLETHFIAAGKMDPKESRAVIDAASKRDKALRLSDETESLPFTSLIAAGDELASNIEKVRASNISNLSEQEKTEARKQHVLDLEHLRTEFGWDKRSAPFMQLSQQEGDKVCFYFEVPPNLPPEKSEAWLKALVKLKTGISDINFKRQKPVSKHGIKKPNFQKFIVHPHKIQMSMFEGQNGIPTVVPLGDAQIEPIYRKGQGLKSGIERADGFLDSIEVNKKTGEIIAIDRENYREKLDEAFEKHEGEIHDYYDARVREETSAYESEAKLYLMAYEAADASERKIIEPGLLYYAEKHLKDCRVGEAGIEAFKYAASVYVQPDIYDNHRLDELLSITSEVADMTGMSEEETRLFLARTILSEAAVISAIDVVQDIQQKFGVVQNAQVLQEIMANVQPKIISIEILQELTKGFDPAEEKSVFDYALQLALKNRNMEQVEKLGQLADYNQVNERGDTLLHRLILIQTGNERPRQKEAALLTLIKLGADVNTPNRDGITPLMTAARLSSTNIAEILIAHGADLNAKDRMGRTPLDHTDFNITDETRDLIKEALSKESTEKEEDKEVREKQPDRFGLFHHEKQKETATNPSQNLSHSKDTEPDDDLNPHF